ncbi:MAG: DUF3078 domain-containing protein [Sphingobacteriales bacterium]|nr:MAG: DUF3078 domain-containing protein [Sphingobacteriales bacterium]
MVNKKGLTAILLIAATCFFANSYGQLSRTDSVAKSFEVPGKNSAWRNRDTIAWVKGGHLTIGFNQGFLHNWAAGGELGSLTVNGMFSGYLDRIYHRQIWANNLDMNYSLFYAYSNFFVPQKINDRIDYTSRYGIRLDTAKNFFLTGLFNFKSQFTKGYDYSVPDWDTFSTSEFLSPAYFILAAGLEYRKGAGFSLFYSPVASRVTLADRYYTLRSPEGAFGVPYGETARYEIGSYFSGRHQWNIKKNMMLKTRLDLYSNYLAKDRQDSTGKTVAKDDPGNIDVFIDLQYTWKVAKYIAFSFGTTAIYDNDIPYEKSYLDETGAAVLKDEPGQSLGWWQIRQVFTLTFDYRF